jgi:hypothetical protein
MTGTWKMIAVFTGLLRRNVWYCGMTRRYVVPFGRTQHSTITACTCRRYARRRWSRHERLMILAATCSPNTSIPSIPVQKSHRSSGEWKEESRKRPVVLWVSVHETVRVVLQHRCEYAGMYFSWSDQTGGLQAFCCILHPFPQVFVSR